MPEAAFNQLNPKCPAKLGWRSGPSVQNRPRELPVELRTVVFAVKTAHTGSALVSTERVVNALPSTLRGIVDPDSELVLEERRQSTNFGFRVAIGHAQALSLDSGVAAWTQRLSISQVTTRMGSS